MHRVARIILFLALLPVAYLGVTFALQKVPVKGTPLLRLVSGNQIRPGGWGQALRKFREVAQAGSVDLLFLGSSHTYRGFDPRIFSAAGYRCYNLGTTSQTPLNTYFLLKRYCPQLKPRLAVLEVYPLLLSTDGVESFLDLAANMPLSQELVEMGLALRNPQALNALIGTQWERLRTPLASFSQKEIDNESYIPGGYCETKLAGHSAPFPTKGFRIEVSDRQVEYLRRVVRYLGEHQVKVVLVTQPFPVEYLRCMKNYAAVTATIAAVAREEGVPYIDYNTRIRLDSVRDFYDDDHLTAAGVRKYNELVLADLAGYRSATLRGR